VNETVSQGAQKIQEWIQMAQNLGQMAVEYLVKYGFQVLGGLIILFIGFKLANWAAHLFIAFGAKKKFDITLTKFLSNIIRGVILVFVVLMAVEKFGVTINPLIAAASAMIFGASFALQAPLSNYAAGLMVILTRPFVVGNTIQVKGVCGIVEEVKLPCTVLVTEDGERITIPNKEIVGEILYNSAANKVVEKSVGVSYSDDPQKAVDVIREALKRLPRVCQSPAPQIGIESFGDSAINIGLRYWVPTQEYYHVLYEANLAVFRALQQSKITIPFPQQEVRMLNNGN
jgi:small conductance mechanosensitive channel